MTKCIRGISWLTISVFLCGLLLPLPADAGSEAGLTSAEPHEESKLTEKETPDKAESGSIEIPAINPGRKKSILPALLAVVGVGALVALVFILAKKKETGTLQIQTDPPGARIFLNGQDTGRLSNTILQDIPVGLHTLQLSLEEYSDYSTTCLVEKNKTTVIEVTLSMETGSIRINSLPPGAKVYLNGIDTGQQTDTVLSGIPTGSHSLLLSKLGFHDFTATCTVSADQEVLIDAALSFDVNSMEMVRIEGGSFLMGSASAESFSRERPQRWVTLSPFYLGKYEVTQLQWTAIMGSNPSVNKKGDEYPVDNVSWNDVQEFLARINQLSGLRFRLPTEAEWEYAARGADEGDRYGDIYSIAWFDENSGLSSKPAGLKQANRYGFFDMLGNVWEWCQDWFAEYPGIPETNPAGPPFGSEKIVRGGAWNTRAREVRAPFRGYLDPAERFGIIGFRLARD